MWRVQPNCRDQKGFTPVCVSSAAFARWENLQVIGQSATLVRHACSDFCLLLLFRAIAAFHNHASMVELLLKHGADPTLKNAYGKDALAMAQSSRADSSVAV